MAELILKFNLDDPDDFANSEIAFKYKDWYFLAWDFDQYLRNEIKYNNRDELQEVREKFNEFMTDRRLDFCLP